MRQLFISLTGHNASGKTTLAKKLLEDFTFSRINGDDFRYFVRDHIRYFANLDISYPSERNAQLNPIIIRYRLDMAETLLHAGDNVIFDVGSSNKKDRQPVATLLESFPEVVHVIIFADLPEAELLKRLAVRGERWEAMYQDFRKASFQPPLLGEADVVLTYNQHNYDEVKHRIEQLSA